MLANLYAHVYSIRIYASPPTPQSHTLFPLSPAHLASEPFPFGELSQMPFQPSAPKTTSLTTSPASHSDVISCLQHRHT